MQQVKFLTQIMLTSVCIAAGYDNMSLTDLGVASSLKCFVLYLGEGGGGGARIIKIGAQRMLHPSS